jgi:transcriptional regulator with XRE-family HTH domain
MADSSPRTLTFIRQHRVAAKLSLDELASAAKIDKGNLSKLERGLLPYNQDQIEGIAAALDTDVATLLTRNPEEPTPIWGYIDRAKPVVRRQIEQAAEAIFKAAGEGDE